MALEADSRFSTQEKYREFRAARLVMFGEFLAIRVSLFTAADKRGTYTIYSNASGNWMMNALRDDLLSSRI
ncbi:MAG: hypothetical protein RLZZ283_112 [Candidatus Parcubacteria bacterium]|jgi:hypothetical protein